jgi:hypothetical protein
MATTIHECKTTTSTRHFTRHVVDKLHVRLLDRMATNQITGCALRIIGRRRVRIDLVQVASGMHCADLS